MIFGLNHAYQGIKGVILTAALGTLFALIFICSGSLWLPILVHAFVDARLVFLRTEPPPPPVIQQQS